MNENEMLPIKKDTLITITKGVYSDYNIIGIFKSLTNIDANQILQKYLELNSTGKEEYSFDSDKFVSWLVIENLIEQTENTIEWHLEDYCIPQDEMFVSEMNDRG